MPSDLGGSASQPTLDSGGKLSKLINPSLIPNLPGARIEQRLLKRRFPRSNSWAVIGILLLSNKLVPAVAGWKIRSFITPPMHEKIMARSLADAGWKVDEIWKANNDKGYDDTTPNWEILDFLRGAEWQDDPLSEVWSDEPDGWTRSTGADFGARLKSKGTVLKHLSSGAIMEFRDWIRSSFGNADLDKIEHEIFPEFKYQACCVLWRATFSDTFHSYISPPFDFGSSNALLT